MAYYVYLLASDKYGTLYLGVTNDIVRSAIAREKELKKWRRKWKIRLIEERNPQWIDLYPQISA